MNKPESDLKIKCIKFSEILRYKQVIQSKPENHT